VTRAVLLLALALAGCTDFFMLPGAPNDLAMGGVILHQPDLFFIPGPVLSDGGVPIRGSDSGGLLPSSCALLSCSPGSDEGNVTVTSGTLTGCHAYQKLIIGSSVLFDTFTACAISIEIDGTLDGSGGGWAQRMGPGAGSFCGSGASHGGTGADPTHCGIGPTYGDATHPRETGSGGGSFGGGKGGGQIELAAGTVLLNGLIRASGMDGEGASAGGGSGGSVLIEADTIIGSGRVEARGGKGFGLAGGGGGGGRVAVLKTMGLLIAVDVTGGDSVVGPPAAVGTVTQP
jgi:hypothetical protein